MPDLPPAKSESITITLTRDEANALVDSISHGDIAYGQSWTELVDRREVDARYSAIAKLEEALGG